MPFKQHGKFGRMRGHRLAFFLMWPFLLLLLLYFLPSKNSIAPSNPFLNPSMIIRSNSDNEDSKDGNTRANRDRADQTMSQKDMMLRDEDDGQVQDPLNAALTNGGASFVKAKDGLHSKSTISEDDRDGSFTPAAMHSRDEVNKLLLTDLENKLTDSPEERVEEEQPKDTNPPSKGSNIPENKSIKKERIKSKARIIASTSGSGLVNKFYYKFENVKLKRRKLTVYYDPEKMAPPSDYWVDIVSTNGSTPQLPTMLVIKGDVHDTKWYYLPVVYEPADRKQPKCKSWVDNPTYLLQARYSYNIWHTWNEGLMGVFQTLRELGHLPLASVGSNGEMTEISDGKGEGCTYEWDPEIEAVVKSPSCAETHQDMSRKRCDPSTEPWCREGAVVSLKRYEDSPIILPYTASSVVNVWAHLYHAMTSDIRDWADIDDTCFKELIVGKTSTLNFYQALNTVEPTEEELEMWPRLDATEARVEAMAVFKAFVTSSQREWVSKQLKAGEKPFAGYSNPNMEILRQGIGPEDLESGIIEEMLTKSVPGMVRSELQELRDLSRKKFKETKELIKSFKKKYGPVTMKIPKPPKEVSKIVQEQLDDYEAIAALEDARKGSGEGTSPRRQFGGYKRLLSANQTHSEITPLESDYLRYNAEGNSVLSPHSQISKWFVKGAVYRHEEPRPVVVYMSRNFFSRGVLNEADILGYILTKYNVTVKVTTFEEPLLEVMETLGSADVLFGMHGAGWTNALFVKRGATAMQMFPYGWRLPDGSTVRGYNYREIVYASECHYSEWVNQRREYAFFRRIDYQKQWNLTYSLHPDPSWPLPHDSWPGNPWIYQNTYVDMDDFKTAIDAMMKQARISPMPGM